MKSCTFGGDYFGDIPSDAQVLLFALNTRITPVVLRGLTIWDTRD